MTDLDPAPDRMRLFIADGKSPARERRRHMPVDPRDLATVGGAEAQPQLSGAH